MQDHSILLINTLSDFSELAEDWDKLANRNKYLSIFQSHSFIKSWLDVYGEQVEISIIVVKDSKSKIIFIAPMMVTNKIYFRYFKFRTMMFIGSERSDYCDFIYDKKNDNIFFYVLDFIKSNFPNILVLIQNISELSPTYNFLKHMKDKKILFEQTKCRYLDLSNIDIKKYKKKNIQNLKRRLEKKSELQILDLNYSSGENEFLKMFFKQHQSKWNKNSLFTDKKNRLLYKKLFKYLFLDKKIDFKALKQNNNILAMHFGFSHDKKFYYYKPTYNHDFSIFSPGIILLQYLIEYSIESGHKVFDFGSGNEPYKKRFSNKSHLNYSYIFTFNNYYKHLLIRFLNYLKNFINYLN